MHISALNSFLEFKKNYLKDKTSEIKIVEIGSQSINESIKKHLDKNHKYTGVDIVKGNNVDIVLDDPYKLPFEKDSIIEFLSDKVAKWWLPDEIIFLKELPHGATGKLQKFELREEYNNYYMEK